MFQSLDVCRLPWLSSRRPWASTWVSTLVSQVLEKNVREIWCQLKKSAYLWAGASRIFILALFSRMLRMLLFMVVL